MQESDNILYASLKQVGFRLEDRIRNVSEITSDDLMSICIQLLEMFNVDMAQVKELGKSQKFRVATKVNQLLTKHVGTQFELNDLMNSNINSVRKVLMSLLSKLSLLESENKTQEAQYLSPEEKAKKDAKQRREKMWKSWTSKEWIHPALIKQKDVNFGSHLLRYDLNDDIQKKNIVRDFQHPTLQCNIQSILSEMYSLYSYTKKKQTAEQGIKINRQGNAEVILNTIVENNRPQWAAYKTNNKKINKMKKKLIDQTKKEENKTESQPSTTIFQQQVQELVEIDRLKDQSNKKDEQKAHVEAAEVVKEDPMQKIKLDIEKIKKNHEREINEFVAMVENKEQYIRKLQEKEVKIEQDITRKEEQAVKFKASLTTLKKEAEKKQVLLNSFESPETLNKEVKQLSEELKMLQQQAKSEIQRMQDEIKTIEQQGSEKLSILTEIKEKLSKVEQDYIKITKEIAEKAEQKNFIKIPQGGISRNYYNKRITELEVRWKEGKKEIEKAEDALSKLNNSIGIGCSTANRIQTEIENALNMDKNKNDSLNKLIREQYQRYRTTFKDSMKAMNMVTELRTESREYELLSADLSGKNYKMSIEKLKYALEDIRKERESYRRR